jgi:hypothetical protein
MPNSKLPISFNCQGLLQLKPNSKCKKYIIEEIKNTSHFFTPINATFIPNVFLLPGPQGNKGQTEGLRIRNLMPDNYFPSRLRIQTFFG